MSKKNSYYPSLIKSEELVVQTLEDELLIYNLKTNQAICLNQTASMVWQSCDGKSSINEIKQKLEKKFGEAVKEELVLFAIDELNEKGLIENGGEIPNKFKGLSRREIVRKVGFASLVSLPIVSSIVAPKAASARTVMDCVTAGQIRNTQCQGDIGACSRSNYCRNFANSCCPGSTVFARCIEGDPTPVFETCNCRCRN